MKYLKIKSKGCIEPEAFILMGASTKRGDENSIGFFGSGAKYSLSALCRKKIAFKVFSGEEEIVFTTKESVFRGASFDVIQVNGKDTSLTTTMGGDDWNDSFSYIREIYSNALDEDENAVLEIVENPIGEEGYTCYFIEYTEDVKKFYENMDNYFCSKRKDVLFSNDIGSVYTATDKETRIFRKGIVVYHDPKLKAHYNYNSPNLKINEARTLSDNWEARYRAARIWEKCNDENLIREFIYNIEGGNAGSFEHKMAWGSYLSLSQSWVNVVSTMKFVGVEHKELFDKSEIKGRIALPFEFLKAIRTSYKDLDVLGMSVSSEEIFVEVKNPSQILQDKVIDAMGVLYETDYTHRLTDPVIKYVKFENKKVLGMAHNEEILLSTKLDASSVAEIAKVIIEENEHNLTGYYDKTREFQDHLFNLFYDQLTRKKQS